MSYNFNKIKEHYKYLTPYIFKQGKNNKRFWVSPYSRYIDWVTMFSPIEMQTWFALRGFGQVPLYPQYPVHKYFVDFGNPFVKVAIECDGKEWHTDTVKDKNRDQYLSKDGWVVYRISGSDCFKIEKDYDDLEYKNEKETEGILQNYYSSTIEGLIKSVAIFHFGYKTYNKYVNEYELAAQCLLDRISIGKEKYQEVYNRIIIENVNNIPNDLKTNTIWI